MAVDTMDTNQSLYYSPLTIYIDIPSLILGTRVSPDYSLRLTHQIVEVILKAQSSSFENLMTKLFQHLPNIYIGNV